MSTKNDKKLEENTQKELLDFYCDRLRYLKTLSERLDKNGFEILSDGNKTYIRTKSGVLEINFIRRSIDKAIFSTYLDLREYGKEGEAKVREILYGKYTHAI